MRAHHAAVPMKIVGASMSMRRVWWAGPTLVSAVLLAGCGDLVNHPSRGTVTEITHVIDTTCHSGPFAISPDGRFLALPQATSGEVDLWTLSTNRKTVLESSLIAATDGSNHAKDVVFSHDGRRLAVEIVRRGISIWDPSAGKEITRIPIDSDHWVVGMAFAPGDRELIALVVSCTDEPVGPEKGIVRRTCIHRVHRWDAATGEHLGARLLEEDLSCEALSPDGRYGAFRYGVSWWKDREPPPSVYDLTTGAKVCDVEGLENFVFSTDGSILVSRTRERIRLWEIPSGKLRRQIRISDSVFIHEIVLSPDRKLLAVVPFDRDDRVGLFRFESGDFVAAFDCYESPNIPDSVRFAPDGKMLVTNSGGFSRHVRDSELPFLPPAPVRFWRIAVP